MARQSWLNEDVELPALDARVQELEHFTDALADGVVDSAELSAQEARLVDALRAAEAALDDEQHALVTTALLELSAYNIMSTLHELTGRRIEDKFGG